MLLHTAGADGRQFHELLCDVEIAEKWRMLAFDLPMHGKSIPSPGWWREPYRLTTQDYAHWCVAFIRAVAGQRAVVMGCSMGGAMAVYLAAHHREDVAASVCLEAPDRSPGRHNLFLCHARVNQAAHNPTYVYNLMSPFSPLEARRRAWWYYSQGGFGVYAGDLHFYSSEWDSSLVAGKIDVSDCPVVLLTGEYDYSASPESTRRLAEQIPGARLEIMAKLGHFPMAEDPDRFRAHLVPVPRGIGKKAGRLRKPRPPLKRTEQERTEPMSIVRAAVVQDFPAVFDREATLVKVRELLREAAALSAELVVFPEAFVSGYPKGLDFGARIGMRLPGGREDFRRYFQSAVEIPGPAVEALGAAARESRVHLVIGVIEREIGTLYCTICIFSPEGRLLGERPGS